MNELFDKLIIRVVFTVFICASLLLYQYAHTLMYPTTRYKIFKKFSPSKNPADSVHIFSRLLGVGLLFSEFYFYMSKGIVMALVDFSFSAICGLILYIASLYILESIVLYNFEYNDEVSKKKNMSYAIVSLAHSLGLGFLLKTIYSTSNESLLVIIFLWLLVIVLIGLATKTFGLYSKLSFNRLIIQKNMAVSFSYTGFFWGWILLITNAIEHKLTDFPTFLILVFIKLILSLIILPIFQNGLRVILRIQESKEIMDSKTPDLGHGIYEGILFLTSCLLTSIITGQIHFGTFYPVY